MGRGTIQGIMMNNVTRATAKVFLKRWYQRTEPPPPCPTPYMHGSGLLGCFECFTSSVIAHDFQQRDRPGA